MSALPPKADIGLRSIARSGKVPSTVVTATTYIHVKVSPDLPQGDPPNPPSPLCDSPDNY
jgi:hypothetical protein